MEFQRIKWRCCEFLSLFLLLYFFAEQILGGREAKRNDEFLSCASFLRGSSGVGKTALTYQFTTSEYICAYDLSLDDDYGQKTVSVLLNGQETDLEVVDHPACEMSVSYSNYNPRNEKKNKNKNYNNESR